jgi:hypothetical protein
MPQVWVTIHNDTEVSSDIMRRLPRQNHPDINERRKLIRRHAKTPHLFKRHLLHLRQLLPQRQVGIVRQRSFRSHGFLRFLTTRITTPKQLEDLCVVCVA